uniref:Uncharacterized protein n=1 Tax=Anguilla anguilla TaxID=7936 RepID=A0A0E9XKB6_ANGAN
MITTLLQTYLQTYRMARHFRVFSDRSNILYGKTSSGTR